MLYLLPYTSQIELVVEKLQALNDGKILVLLPFSYAASSHIPNSIRGREAPMDEMSSSDKVGVFIFYHYDVMTMFTNNVYNQRLHILILNLFPIGFSIDMCLYCHAMICIYMLP